MTWVWPIFSSLLLAAPAFPAEVTGRVSLVDSQLPAVRKHQDNSGVVVWLEPLGQSVEPVFTGHHATMEQKGKRFLPHILAIQTGTVVSFPNADPIFHSAFSNFNGQVFDLGLYAPGTNRSITFRRPGVVRIFCNIHPTMSALIVVLKHPWFAISNAEGTFSIPGVPPGTYRFCLFHERTSPGTMRALEHTVEVSANGLGLPLLTISETGYVAEPHKNKYGHDYPPGADENSDYSAGRK